MGYDWGDGTGRRERSWLSAATPQMGLARKTS